MRAVLTLCLIVVCAGPGCGGRSGDSRGARAGRRDCERLRAHLVEIRLQAVSLDREEHRRALDASLGEDFVQTCVDTMPPREVACGRAARDAAALAACARQ